VADGQWRNVKRDMVIMFVALFVPPLFVAIEHRNEFGPRLLLRIGLTVSLFAVGHGLARLDDRLRERRGKPGNQG
jgi:NhaP-type Na+/H+ or K+/H+ antiporter